MTKSVQIVSALFIFSNAALASPEIDIDTNYYSISGSTANELRREMNAKSRISQSGQTYDAYTSWHINWHFKWNINSGHCYMTDVKSIVKVEFTLPRWVNRSTASRQLRNKWDKYYKALVDHENGHKDIGTL